MKTNGHGDVRPRRRTPRQLAVLGGLIGAAAALGATAPVTALGAGRPASPATPTLTIYLAPANKGGSDSHTGLTTSSPILTLAQAQQVLARIQPKTDVQVRIEQGTYVAAETDWTFYIPGHTISFMPINYVLGHGRPPGGDPVFAETPQHFWWWFHALEPASVTAPLHNGGTTGLRFYYLEITGYANGIGLDGVNGNSVAGMRFIASGAKFRAIPLTDSSNNVISNNTFETVENTGSTTGQIHGIYDTHFSSGNTITLNKFESISAKAIKVRDRSNFNVIEHNTFISTGPRGGLVRHAGYPPRGPWPESQPIFALPSVSVIVLLAPGMVKLIRRVASPQ